MSVIYDEYEHVPKDALAILDEAEFVIGKNDPRVINQRAKVLLEFVGKPCCIRALRTGA